jgi:GTPase SAR1 family protein
MSGKTKLLTRYKFGSYNDDGSITVGVDSLIIKTKQAKFSYYDTAGQDKY